MKHTKNTVEINKPYYIVTDVSSKIICLRLKMLLIFSHRITETALLTALSSSKHPKQANIDLVFCSLAKKRKQAVVAIHLVLTLCNTDLNESCYKTGPATQLGIFSLS